MLPLNRTGCCILPSSRRASASLASMAAILLSSLDLRVKISAFWTLIRLMLFLSVLTFLRNVCTANMEGRKEMFYLMTHSTHFIYGYMASDIWLRTILIVRKETRCRHIVYSFRLAARVLLYEPYHRQDSTYHGLCYTSRGALAGMRNNSMGPLHEGSIWWPIAPWANALTTELHLAPLQIRTWIIISIKILHN